MAVKVFQNVIVQMNGAIDRPFGVVDEKGYVIASSDLAAIGAKYDEFNSLVFTEVGATLHAGGRSYTALNDGSNIIDFCAYVEGEDAMADSFSKIIAVAFNESKHNYDEKHNKAAFIKNIISDNILPGDVYVRAKELNFVTDAPRIAILARQEGSNPDVAAVEVISRLFPDKQKDFVININEADVVVIKELKKADNIKEANAAAAEIEKHLHEELGENCIIGISTVANHLRELADRYKEAQVAIDVGCVFDSEKTIINYDQLGLGRIIYQLPTTLCEMFLNEVFKKNSIDSLDDDTLETINRFFENNLNVSETSRKLYVHRNTLVYRLEKIKKLTGLDLREFDHAIVFKVAMMVKMYLDSLNNNR